MKLHYAGKYSGNPDDIPCMEHEPGAVAFKEAPDAKSLGRIANTVSVIILIVCYALACLRVHGIFIDYLGVVLYLLTIIPHEFLHAICFKDDVYLFQDLKHGMLFVTGPERMSKARFVFLSLLPNIVFGLIPYIIFMINPELTTLGMLGVLCLASGAGDYYNVCNALTQMPKGAWAYGHKFSTYWYMPKK